MRGIARSHASAQYAARSHARTARIPLLRSAVAIPRREARQLSSGNHRPRGGALCSTFLRDAVKAARRDPRLDESQVAARPLGQSLLVPGPPARPWHTLSSPPRPLPADGGQHGAHRPVPLVRRRLTAHHAMAALRISDRTREGTRLEPVRRTTRIEPRRRSRRDGPFARDHAAAFSLEQESFGYGVSAGRVQVGPADAIDGPPRFRRCADRTGSSLA